jgi:hypothetical protein
MPVQMPAILHGRWSGAAWGPSPRPLRTPPCGLVPGLRLAGDDHVAGRCEL